jgi:N6-adenosine-specific RNA methylase IME4
MIAQPLLFEARDYSGWAWPGLEPHAYDLIMIDPPWRFELYSAKGEAKSAQAHYETMSLDAIKALPVRMLAKPNCLLWLWATAPMLPQQLECLDAWGFGYKSEGVWVKTTVNGKVGFGTGYGFRGSHEPIILAGVGSPQVTHSTRSVIMGLARGHSRKPDAAYAAAEAMMPSARRADVFSRQTRPGWEAFGKEAGKFDQSTPKESLGVANDTGDDISNDIEPGRYLPREEGMPV